VSQTLLNGRYRLEAELGQGGMGTVHRAFDTTLEREVAVKLVTGYEFEAEGRARLLKEAKSIAQLNHPNIVTVYDAGEQDQAPYIVMELVEGSSLHEHPPEKLDALIQTAIQICTALDHAHERGIVHRDLKPENVLIDSDGSAKLMDFGIARSMASRMTQEGRIEGTVFYMAPELALGKEYDGRADLYALGVMLYELATGDLPFQHGDPVAVISQHVHAPVVPPRAKDSEIPPGLDRLIVQLMEKDAEERPPNAAAVLKALQEPTLLKLTGDEEQLSTLDRIVRGRMIGREAEFNQARELWYSTLEGNSQILLVSGEPGVGKTRLLREIITQSEVMGAQVLGSASYAEGGPPYSPFKQILREVLPKASKNGFNLPDPVVADLLSLAPEFREDFPEVAPNPSEDPTSDQHRLFESFFVFVATLSRHSPLMIYLDDVHWADSGSLNLFRHLARQLGSQPIMLLATYRDVEVDEARPLHEVLLDLGREPRTTRIKLNRLTVGQTEELLAAFFQEEITPEFRDGIYRETDGNPFFIEEVCKALVESGQLIYKDGHWDRPDMSELGIPQSVRAAIQSRVGQLSPKTQELLVQAAVLGREFKFATLLAAVDVGEDEVIEALEEADRAQLIEERNENGDIAFAFTHALVPSTLVDGLRMLQRRRFHKRAAEALGELDPENHAALALHLLESGQTEQGVVYLVRAGDQARTQYANQEAIDSYLQALDFAKETEDYAQAARTLMKLGLTYHNAFQYKESRQAYEEGFIYLQRSPEATGAHAASKAPHSLRIASLPPITFDPGLVIDTTSANFISELFSGLVQLTPDLSVVPDVARSWDVVAGGREYQFHLRDDVFWSDGHPVRAADFEYAWRRVLDPSMQTFAGDFFLDVKGAQAYANGEGSPSDVGIHAPDDLTLIVELEHPTGYFLQLLAHSSSLPVPRHIVESNGEDWTEIDKIATNGAFLLATWEPEQRITLERNPKYHGNIRGNVERVDASIYQESGEDPLRWYEEDKLDFLHLYWLSPQEADRARHLFANDYLNTPTLALLFLSFDSSRAPFDDPRVRKAFSLAIDREALAEISFRGQHSPATGGFLPPGVPGHMPDMALPFDVGQARELLKEAGFLNGSAFPEVECLSPLLPAHEVLREHIQSQWLEHLGIDIVWDEVEMGDFIARLQTQIPNVHTSAWTADYPDPDNFLRIGAKEAMEAWENAKFQDLVESARRSINQEERISKYIEAQEILTNEVPLFPLTYNRGHALLKPWISQFPMTPMRVNDWKNVVIEDHD
jgi:ABC-type oligopeptide transport system substrate-binding subunit/serine/threonine protein kinase